MDMWFTGEVNKRAVSTVRDDWRWEGRAWTPGVGGGGGDLPKHTRFQTDGSDNTAHGGKT